ncbi:hypothetical protein C8R45DRAFT_1214246 [Mycena sanguinolenta]|nr:hypothetical protein C8R45DRAFT_1214246 [Mycena sanguinolenta]
MPPARTTHQAFPKVFGLSRYVFLRAYINPSGKLALSHSQVASMDSRFCRLSFVDALALVLIDSLLQIPVRDLIRLYYGSTVGKVDICVVFGSRMESRPQVTGDRQDLKACLEELKPFLPLCIMIIIINARLAYGIMRCRLLTTPQISPQDLFPWTMKSTLATSYANANIIFSVFDGFNSTHCSGALHVVSSVRNIIVLITIEARI